MHARSEGMHQDDAALEEVGLSNVPVDGLKKCHSAKAAQGVKRNIHHDIVYKAFQQLHLCKGKVDLSTA